VCEAAAHALYMQQQLPMPWPKCAEWHAVALAERAADATTRLPGARRRGMTSGPPRHLALAAAAATQLFQALHAVFACADPGAIASGGGGGGISPERLALVFGPSPRRAQWVVLLDFSACGPPSAAVPSNGALMDADLTSKSGSSGSSRNKGGPGLSTEEDRMLDACGRRLKRTLLEVAMQTPPARGGIPGGVATRASKLHVLFQFAPPSGGGRRELVGSGGSRGGEGPAAEVLAPRENSTVGPGFSGGFGFNFNDAAVMLPRSRLPAALLRAVDALQLPPPVGAAAAAAAAAATRPVRSKRPAKGWPAAPWLLRFGKDSAHRASASAAPPSPTSMAATPPPPGSLSSMSSSGSSSTAAAHPLSPPKRSRPPSPAIAAAALPAVAVLSPGGSAWREPSVHGGSSDEEDDDKDDDEEEEEESGSSASSDAEKEEKEAEEEVEEAGDCAGHGSDLESQMVLSQLPPPPFSSSSSSSSRSSRSSSSSSRSLPPLRPLPALGRASAEATKGEGPSWFYLHRAVVKGVPQGRSSK
jgi:hypothetical protein